MTEQRTFPPPTDWKTIQTTGSTSGGITLRATDGWNDVLLQRTTTTVILFARNKTKTRAISTNGIDSGRYNEPGRGRRRCVHPLYLAGSPDMVVRLGPLFSSVPHNNSNAKTRKIFQAWTIDMQLSAETSNVLLAACILSETAEDKKKKARTTKKRKIAGLWLNYYHKQAEQGKKRSIYSSRICPEIFSKGFPERYQNTRKKKP